MPRPEPMSEIRVAPAWCSCPSSSRHFRWWLLLLGTKNRSMPSWTWGTSSRSTPRPVSQQYLPDQPVATSWGALFHFDFSNANLLILLGCDPHLRYVPEDIQTITAFLQEGGGVVLLGSAADKPQNALGANSAAPLGSLPKPLASAAP